MTADTLNAPVTVLGRYTLPPEPMKVGDDWDGCAIEGYVPCPRRKLLMDAVEVALREGLFYNRDVVERVAALVQVSAQERSLQMRPAVEGGVFGYDVYMARKAVEAGEEHKLRRSLALAMQLREGENIGRLIFTCTGGKVESAVTVNQVHERGHFTLISKRGAQQVRIHTDAIGLRDAIDAAARRARRKTNFEQFVAERVQPGDELHGAELAAPVRERQRG